MRPTIIFEKIHPNAIIPKYQTKGSSGFDLHVVEDYKLFSNDTFLLRTGLRCEILFDFCSPIDFLFELQIRPRGGVSYNTPLRISNSPGTIDNDYRGEILILVTNTGHKVERIAACTRIAQGIITPIVQANIVEAKLPTTTERGEGRLGSTGEK